MAEIDLLVLSRQSLERRIPDAERLARLARLYPVQS
jgi:hypothetical protein